MIDEILDYFNNLKINSTLIVFMSPIIVSACYIGFHLYDVFIDNFLIYDSLPKDLNKEDIKFIFKNELSYISKYDFLKISLNYDEIINNELFYKSFQRWINLHNSNDYDHFVGRMKPTFKNMHINMLRSIDNCKSHEDFKKLQVTSDIISIVVKNINK